MIRDFFKRWPTFYYSLVVVFGPVLLIGLNPKQFLKKYGDKGKIVNLGSGPKVIRPDIINVDAIRYPGVMVVADLTKLPFESESISRVICDNVLEHVEDAPKAVSEIERILEKKGLAYISTPFLYPFHSSPSDYHRFTEEGLRSLFSQFEMIDLGVRSGPFSALNTYLCYLFATIFSFGSERLFWILVDFSIFIFFPIKFFDLLFVFLPTIRHTAAVYYCVVKKR
ncbi:MAG: methyltransferase domain-containing protein [bacterium]|nr:methyltransferase domain-containing protein [bacterium]